jgi:hypothetical protein
MKPDELREVVAHLEDAIDSLAHARRAGSMPPGGKIRLLNIAVTIRDAATALEKGEV